MASYSNFSQSVQSKHKVNAGEVNEENTVLFKTEGMKDSFDRNLDKWIYFSSWSRWYPDLFLDLIHPDKGGIVLDLDQRVFLRSTIRFLSVYGVYPRAYGKTFVEVLSLFLICLFYPNIEVAMTAQTQANAAKMLKDKYNEIIRYWPILAGEIYGKPSFNKDTAEIRFNNGSIMNVLANNQNSKGQRRKRINIEESALLDNFTFDDALKPIVDFPRYTIGNLAMVNPEEISQRINFFTTAGRLPLCVVICIENLMNTQSVGRHKYVC